MKSIKNSLITAAAIAFMILTPQIVLALAPADPFFYVSINPKVGEVEIGGSATFTIGVLSQEGFEGNVQLELIDAPDGVSATFEPNPVFVPGFSEEFVTVTIDVASTVSEGEIELSIMGTDVAGVSSNRGTSLGVTVISGGASVPPPASGPPPASVPPPASGPPAGEVITTTVTTTVTTSTIVTTPTTIVSTVTQIITTKTSSIISKTVVDEFNQANDIIYPLVTLAGIVVIVGGVIVLRRPNS